MSEHFMPPITEKAAESTSEKVPEKTAPKVSQQSAQDWYVYIVQCADNTLYTGIAKNVSERIEKHNAGIGAKYTRTRTPVTELYRESCADRSQATKRELAIKKLSRKQKFALIGRT